MLSTSYRVDIPSRRMTWVLLIIFYVWLWLYQINALEKGDPTASITGLEETC